jgi:hypothetical protein
VFVLLTSVLSHAPALEVPHNNGQVRLNHCLKICERIIGRAVNVDDVVSLEDSVCALAKLVSSESPDNAGSDRAASSAPPPEEED